MNDKVSVVDLSSEKKVIDEETPTSKDKKKRESSHANSACEICEGMQCLCEVVLTLKDGLGGEKAFYWESKEETPIPEQLFLIDSGKSADEDDEKKDYSIDFKIVGECSADEVVEACCKIEQWHHIKHRHQWSDMESEKEGSFSSLGFDANHAFILGAIDENGRLIPKSNESSNAYLPYKNPQQKMLLKEIQDAEKHAGNNLFNLNIIDWHFNFLFFNKLSDYPYSSQSILVYECNLGESEDEYGIVSNMQIVSMPYYSQSLDVNLEFSRDKDNAKLEFSYIISMDKSEVTLTTPEAEQKIPYIGKMLKNLSQNIGFNKFGFRGGLKLPKIAISTKAELADGYLPSSSDEEKADHKGLIVKRSGTFKGDPILGAEIAVDILKAVQVACAATGVGSAVTAALEAVNIFKDTVGIRGVEDLMKVLKGPKESWWKFWKLRAAATIFIQGSVDIEGEFEFKDSSLFDSPEDFTEKKAQKDEKVDFATDFELGGVARLGLYGGAWAEGTILGVGAGAGAAMEAVVMWKLLYQLKTQQITGWYEGFELTIKGEAAVGKIDSENNGNNPSIKMESGGLALDGDGYTVDVSGGVEVKATSVSGHVDVKVSVPGESKDTPCLIYEF